MNKREACEDMIKKCFNSIPWSLIEKAYKDEGINEYIVPIKEPEPEDFNLKGDYEPEKPDADDYKSEWDEETETFIMNEEDKKKYEDAIAEYNDNEIKWNEYSDAHDNWEYENENNYPMWGWVFECSESYDADKIREHIDEIHDLGFIVIDGMDELELCLGFAGAGYDFYSAHWIPLYDFLGYNWHDEEIKESN